MPNIPTDRRAVRGEARNELIQADALAAVATFKQAVAKLNPGDARTARRIFMSFVNDITQEDPPVPHSAKLAAGDSVDLCLDWIAAVHQVVTTKRKEGWIVMEGSMKVIFYWVYRNLAHHVFEEVINGVARQFYTDKVQKACTSTGWPDVLSVHAFKACLSALIKAHVPGLKTYSSLLAQGEHLVHLGANLSLGILIFSPRCAFSPHKLYNVKGAGTGRKAILDQLNADTQFGQNARTLFTGHDYEDRKMESALNMFTAWLLGTETAKVGSFIRMNGPDADEEEERADPDVGEEEGAGDSGVELGSRAEDEALFAAAAAAAAAAATVAGKKRQTTDNGDGRSRKKKVPA
ncbi:hypothetical protein HDU86_000017 [Geranomyces michiganensis]|nr:hypothetical protein HDU86_000017 [Geranomyces michiganensis]